MILTIYSILTVRFLISLTKLLVNIYDLTPRFENFLANQKTLSSFDSIAQARAKRIQKKIDRQKSKLKVLNRQMEEVLS